MTPQFQPPQGYPQQPPPQQYPPQQFQPQAAPPQQYQPQPWQQPAPQQPAPQGYPQQPQQYQQPAYGMAPPPQGGPSFAGIFTGIDTAKPMLNSEYVKPGAYWLRIDKCKIDQTRNHEPFFAIEMTVVRVLDNAGGIGHSCGNAVTRLVKRAGQSANYFLPEMNAFIAGVLGISHEQVTQDKAEQIFGPQQPFVGMVVEVNAWHVMSRRNEPVTKITWKREVPANELIAGLDPFVKQAYFPGGYLEAEAAKVGAGMAPPIQHAPPQQPAPYPPQQAPGFAPPQQAPAQPWQQSQPAQQWQQPAPQHAPPQQPAPQQTPPQGGPAQPWRPPQ